MTRPKIHGGYSSTPTGGPSCPTNLVMYWTCGHDITLPAATRPHMDCPRCAVMTDAELEAMIKAKNLVVEAVEAPA